MKQIIVFFVSIFFTLSAVAETNTILIKEGKLSTTEINFPANKPIEFKIKNSDESFEGFKSKALNLKIQALPMNSEITIAIPSLEPGFYPFKVEFKGKLLGLLEDQIIHGNIIVK